jgi:hypothetical protein
MTHQLTISWLLLAFAGLSSAGSGSVPVTPHDSYSSSVGVLGCKINTNRVAYWPDSVDCTNICVSLSYSGRTVHLLRIDQSGGAHDVSYDAWNYLYTGKSAIDKPTAGGAVQMDYEDVDASQCKDLINTKGGKLPLSASNSMNFLASCLEEEGSWVAGNYVLYNIATPICTYGVDEVCTLDFPAQNQASCPSGIGNTDKLTSDPVVDIRYPTGEKVVAGSDQTVSGPTGLAVGRDVKWGMMVVTVVAGLFLTV